MIESKWVVSSQHQCHIFWDKAGFWFECECGVRPPEKFRWDNAVDAGTSWGAHIHKRWNEYRKG